jgi:pimeloyl-ACP methyl ester carboxylesterase
MSTPPSATGTANSADGTPIHYTVHGRGEPVLVLVHGWAMDETLWAGQVPGLAADHRVVTLDLAGHGRSGRSRTDWTIASLGEDVKAVVDAVDLRRLILVGHSMGGMVALEAARRLGDRVAGIVLVDILLDVEEHTPPEEVEAFAGKLRADYKGTTTFMSNEYLFAPATPAAVRERVLAQGTSMDPGTSIALLRSAWSYDAVPALREIKAPVRAVNADKFPTNVEANRRHMPGYQAEIVAGSGHYPMLEAPERFDAALARVLAGLGA